MTFAAKVEAARLATIELKIGAIVCTVLVVPATFNPTIPYFVGTIGADRFFISDAVPEKFRRGFIGHEANCLALKACGRKGHCVAALDEELKYVPREEHSAYLPVRLEMFEGLLRYMAGQPRSDFTAEIEASRDKLRMLVR